MLIQLIGSKGMNKLVSSPDINASLIDQHKIKEDTYVTTIPLLPLLMIAMFKKKSSSSRTSKFWQSYDEKMLISSKSVTPFINFIFYEIVELE